MSSVTHVAGPTVYVAGRIIQRCAVCGEKLADSQGAMVPLLPDGTAPGFPTWREGYLVHVVGPRSTVGEVFQDVEVLPEDFCLELVEY